MNDRLLPPPSKVFAHVQSAYSANTQPVPANPVHKRSKSDLLLDSLVHYLTNPQVNGRRIILCKNLMDTKYVIWDTEIIFFGEDRLLSRIKSDAYFQIWENMTNTVIKSALQIISEKHQLWILDPKEKRITPIRLISLCRGHFVYFFHSNYSIYSISSNFNNTFITGTFASKSFDIIQTPQNPNFLNEVVCYNNHDLIKSISFLKENLFEKLNISEDCFLIILTWLVQSIACDNYTLLELIGESKSGKSYIQSVLRELIDPNLELLTQAPKKIKDLEKQTMNGHVMSFDDVGKLNEDIQLFMVDLMSVNGAKITYPLESREYSAEIFVRRPIILNSVSPVVTHEKLQSKTLTIELKAPEKKMARIS
jgi:hypothetical protein